MSDSDILGSFRPGEIVDEQQTEELRRWSLLDFCAEDKESFVSDRRLVVVCGCGRSGTTLVRVILDTHPELFAGPEALLFLPVAIDTGDLARKFGLGRPELEAMRGQTGSRARFIERFQDELLRVSGKRLWVDKTARNVHRLDYILQHFPRTRVIHVVRDPRDVVASLKTHKKRKVVDGQIVPTGYCMPVNLCIDRWELALKDALPHLGSDNVHTVRYEDIVCDTERSVRDLCRFVGVDYDPGMLEFWRSTAPTRDYRNFPQNIEATKPISPASIGRYRHTFTAAEIELVEERLADPMQEFGYRGPRRASRTPLPVTPDVPAADEVRVVPSAAIHDLLGADPLLVKEWTREALRAHHEGTFIQPQKSYLVTSDNPYDRIISLPAALRGEEPTLGIKWIGSHSRNVERGRERAHAVIVLNDPSTHAARVIMDGTLISSMRTLAISLIAMDQFAPRPRSVGLFGMGRLGRMHARLLGALYPSIEEINCFSRRAPFDDLLGDPKVRRRTSTQGVLDRSEVIVTCSAATSPYIFADAVGPHCRLVVNLSLMDCDVDVIAQSDHIVVDDWQQNLRAERVFKTGVERGLYGRERVSELSAVLFGPRRNYPGRVFVNPLGMGLEDVHVAGRVARRLGMYP